MAACVNVHLTVDAGQMVWVKGPSGSGKSTMILAVSGMIEVDEGYVELQGIRISENIERERARTRLTTVGVVFQDYLLVREFTACENVMLPLEAAGWDYRSAKEHAFEKLGLVGLDDLGDRYPDTLSGGQRQRVAIARALAGDRTIILADEPTGALDSVSSRQLFELLRQLADQGVALVVASHDTSLNEFADHTYEMLDGRLTSAALSI